MAVYTVLDREEIEEFIRPFGIGPLIEFEGVAAGIENTNYFLSTDQSDFPSELHTETTQHFVLTIFESIEAEELAFFAQLTTYLNLQGLPVPCPIQDADGVALKELQGKPALLQPKLPGEHPTHPTEQQCAAIGSNLAKIHLACMNADFTHRNSHDLDWLTKAAKSISAKLDNTDQELLSEIERFKSLCTAHPDLPQAIIHSDLFRDNALVVDDELTGIIDFYSAGDGYLLLDLAVVINDWCSDHDGSIRSDLSNAILCAYQQVRPLTSDEKNLWNDFLRIAATRFWVSRMVTQLDQAASHRPGSLVEQKDPLHYRNILLQRIHSPQHIA